LAYSRFAIRRLKLLASAAADDQVDREVAAANRAGARILADDATL
jgi:hypothetical protein